MISRTRLGLRREAQRHAAFRVAERFLFLDCLHPSESAVAAGALPAQSKYAFRLPTGPGKFSPVTCGVTKAMQGCDCCRWSGRPAATQKTKFTYDHHD
jgi:hypothetical protein